MEFIPDFELQKAEELIEKHHKLYIKLYCQGVDKRKTFISIIIDTFFSKTAYPNLAQ